jgi:U3 small nucleolar ribonucleoprotein protein LCP5
MDNSLSTLLSTLQESISTAVLPTETAILPPQHGISLLDLKNELFLSYLQNLVFLILIKLRHATDSNNEPEKSVELNEEATKKLVELRLYLEKGVKPLESRLKYQIDKVVRAADDTTAAATLASIKPKLGKPKKADAFEDSGSEDGSSSDESEDVDELSYRPNPAALLRPASESAKTSKSNAPSDGIYRPPRITATAMPTSRAKEARKERPQKSATLDEFIATELSTAPLAEPSIGSTIVAGGRRVKGEKERAEEANRARFEEEMLMRLPAVSKKEKARKGQTERGGGYGGEEWRDLGAGLDRIENLTKRKGGSGGQLDKSRKRKIDVADGPRDSGAMGNGIGNDFAKRKRTVMKRFR